MLKKIFTLNGVLRSSYFSQRADLNLNLLVFCVFAETQKTFLSTRIVVSKIFIPTKWRLVFRCLLEMGSFICGLVDICIFSRGLIIFLKNIYIGELTFRTVLRIRTIHLRVPIKNCENYWIFARISLSVV